MKLYTSLLTLIAATSVLSNSLNKRNYNKCITAIEKSGCPIMNLSLSNTGKNKELCTLYKSDKCQKIYSKGISSIEGCNTLSTKSATKLEKKMNESISELENSCNSIKESTSTKRYSSSKKSSNTIKGSASTKKHSISKKSATTTTTTTTKKTTVTSKKRIISIKKTTVTTTKKVISIKKETTINRKTTSMNTSSEVSSSTTVPSVTSTSIISTFANTGKVEVNGASSVSVITTFLVVFGFFLYNLI
ncbi:hypothetical protein H8356DRAFT_948907 [Neocallimastix lanati (nom. inval.)]|uniref:Extracellular membrane protein CFEM domain-containing protein n=1 Tax=Neocallimastix californiae TaxID=1754190 RepID=A0A1Y2EP19_9FUNG|nr:hypothetical protein H8356DRAFT_948907 [Neocallimastix sp. JGI-2020a]ORY73330.1 hypothetical protein LY90DRAFT_636016 [Neocallimastix californiae]|eukprot:ORY73330.1 hypothetical protein LY90DRAFT_636016 [Neocallimastix californiae]